MVHGQMNKVNSPQRLNCRLNVSNVYIVSTSPFARQAIPGKIVNGVLKVSDTDDNLLPEHPTESQPGLIEIGLII